MPQQYRRDPNRDAWERQPGEPGETFDWFAHWRGEGHRRSYARTAARFDTTTAKVRGAAARYDWTGRLQEWRAANSAQVKERFDELMEQGLAPFAQGFARLSALSATNDGDTVSPDRAGSSAAAMLRVAKEPSTQELIRIYQAGADQLDVGSTILTALEQHPEAKAAAIRALQNQQPDGAA